MFEWIKVILVDFGVIVVIFYVLREGGNCFII